MTAHTFTNDWFIRHKPIWDQLLAIERPTRILEVGSYEGASACYLVDTLACNSAIELHCVDSWQGGVEHRAGGQYASDMSAVEARFRNNVALSQSRAREKVELVVHRQHSDVALAALLAGGKAGYFDLIYIDGSHEAPDVLCDAVFGFRLLRVGGVIVFDDYLWAEHLPYGRDPLRCPKPAIDAFVNLNFRRLDIIRAPLGQLFVRKLAG